MRTILKKATLLLSSLILFAGITAPAAPAFALFENSKDQACSGVTLNEPAATPGTTCPDTSGTVNGLLKTAVNIFSLIIGFIAIIMIIVGGLKYITSAGDSNNVNSAKNTILYAVIGLVIVALAQFIVRFVLAKVR